MILNDLSISHIRNISELALQPHERLNLITGDNGAGKSSLLEAVQCLSVGHSFRSRKSGELIQHQAPSFRVTGVLTDPTDSRIHRAGIERTRDGDVDIRLNYESISSLAELTRLIPVKALTPDSHDLIQRGPELRRQFLDWGVFHVEPLFIEQWRRYRRSLIQRNQLLREQASNADISAWTHAVASAGQAVDQYRTQILKELETYLEKRLSSRDQMFHVKLQYRSGWNTNNTLADSLEQNLDYHRRMKTTTDGPHRADIVISVGEHQARKVLSRGQQKLLVYLLHLAQLDQLREARGMHAIVLCDDLTSELDEHNSHYLVDQLHALETQVFITGVDLTTLKHLPNKGFHVKLGHLQT